MAVYWKLEETLAYYLEDPVIREHLDESEQRRLINADPQFIELLRQALQYQGFDPRNILKQMYIRNKQYKEDYKTITVWDLANGQNDFAVNENTKKENRYTNHETVAKDAHILIFTFLLRCNHISKVIQKSLPGVSDILEMLKTKYDINDEVRASGTSLTCNDITLPRIAGTLPAFAVKLFHDCVVKETVPFLSIPGVQYRGSELEQGTSSDDSTGSLKTRKITHAICCPFLPSLHPMTSLNPENIHALMLFVAVRLDDIIHKKEKNYTPLDDLMSYYRATYTSQASPEKSRVEVFTKIGLIAEGSKQFSAEAREVNQACCKALEKMRETDPFHATFLSMARSGNIMD